MPSPDVGAGTSSRSLTCAMALSRGRRMESCPRTLLNIYTAGGRITLPGHISRWVLPSLEFLHVILLPAQWTGGQCGCYEVIILIHGILGATLSHQVLPLPSPKPSSKASSQRALPRSLPHDQLQLEQPARSWLSYNEEYSQYVCIVVVAALRRCSLGRSGWVALSSHSNSTAMALSKWLFRGASYSQFFIV